MRRINDQLKEHENEEKEIFRRQKKELSLIHDMQENMNDRLSQQNDKLPSLIRDMQENMNDKLSEQNDKLNDKLPSMIHDLQENVNSKLSEQLSRQEEYFKLRENQRSSMDSVTLETLKDRVKDMKDLMREMQAKTEKLNELRRQRGNEFLDAIADKRKTLIDEEEKKELDRFEIDRQRR